MKKIISFLFLICICFSCQSELMKYGQQYQKNGNVASLRKAIELIPIGSDTAYIKKVLGEPIDMGFDYRYLTDLTGENNCVIGAVLHLDEDGKVDDKWVDEICE